MNQYLIIDEVRFKNYQSYGANESIVKLNTVGTTIIEGIDKDNSTDGIGANGVGKAQPLYSKVLTPTGWRTMGDIRAGDEVLTPTGKVSKVIGTYPQPGIRNVYRVHFEDGRTVDVDEDHIWTVSKTRIAADNKDYRVAKEELTTAEIMMDWSLNGKTDIFVPTVTRMWNENSIDPNLQKLFAEQEQDGVDFFQLGISLSDRTIQVDQYEKYVLGLNDRQKMAMLIGILSFSVDVGADAAFVYNLDETDNTNLRHLIVDLVRSMGGKASLFSDHIRIFVPMFGKLVRALPLSSMKLVRATSNAVAHKTVGLKIERFEYIGQMKTKCILIDDPSHLYVTDNFVVTHNTTIVDAVVFGLYGKSMNPKTNLDDLVNNINDKNMHVTVKFHIGNDYYRVHRTRKSKAGAAGNTVTLYHKVGEDGQEKDITPTPVAACNAKVEDIIGIPYDIFIRIVIFSATHQPFLSLPVRHPTNTNQTDIIEHVVRLTELTEKGMLVKQAVQDKELELESRLVLIKSQEEERQRYFDVLENTKQKSVQWERNKAKEIDAIDRKIEFAQTVDVNAELELHANLKLLQSTSKTLQADWKAQKTAHSRTSQKIAKLEQELTHLSDDKCPYCLQQYTDANTKIDEIRSELVVEQNTLAEQTVQLNDLKNDLDEINSLIQTTSDSIQVSEADLSALSNSATELQIQRQTLVNSTNPYNEVVLELEENAPEQVDYTKIDQLKSEVNHLKFLHKLFTKNDSFVRKRLLDRYTPYLNERLHYYLQLLGLPHRVEFKHDMEVEITKFGKRLGFNSVSAGQKARINLALSWAFRDVYQRRYRKVNLSMLDEVLDVGLDAVGVQSAVKMLKHKARTDEISLFVISHRIDQVGNAFDRKLCVVMENGFSRVEVPETN